MDQASEGRKLIPSPDSHAWLVYLVLGIVTTGIYFLLPRVAQGTLYNLIGASAVIAILVGVRLYRPRPALPQSGRKIPFQEFDVGRMKPGITDPSHPNFNNLADWYAKGNVIEVRIPWMMLGFTDPSGHKVWDNLYKAKKVSPVETEGVRVYPVLRANSSSGGSEKPLEVEPLAYSWEGWDVPDFHEREKQSYAILREAFKNKELR